MHAIRFLLVAWLTLWAHPIGAEGLRIATYNAALTRKGPGLLLRDILAREGQVQAAITMIVAAAPDVLLLTKLDYDHGLIALDALAEALAEAGLEYPHRFARRPNSGWRTDLDLDGDGRFGTPDDAQGYGRFAGAAGMAILSRRPLGKDFRDFSTFLWRDLPDALLPEVDGAVFPSDEVFEVQRLASVAAWEVPVETAAGRLTILAFHASPPVFGGPHDRNLRRNHDEVTFWSQFLSGDLPDRPPEGAVVLVGNANLDPERGDGMGQAMRDLLAHPALDDPLPGQPTVDWERTGPMRVDYVLPGRGLRVLDAGVLHPNEVLNADGAALASLHALVWVEVALPPP